MLSTLVGYKIPVVQAKNAHITSASATAAVITLDALANQRYVINNIQWSYTGETITGKITVTYGTSPTTIFEVDVATAGPGGFNPFIAAPVGEVVKVTIGSGGTGAIGKLNIQYSLVAE